MAEAGGAVVNREETTPVMTRRGARVEIRLNRPRVLNRLQPEDVHEIRRMLREIEADKDVRVVVLTGTGRAFSSGYDLGDLARRRAGEVAEDPPDFAAMTLELENLSVPVICRLNGSVYGGATDLALASDFRVGARGMEMFMPAATLGLHYYTAGLERWVRRIGVDAAKDLFLTGRTVTAEELLRMGWLTHLTDREGLDATVDALADRLAANAPVAVAGMKRALNEISRGSLDRAAADARHAASLISDEMAEGVAAWKERRRPRFTGR